MKRAKGERVCVCMCMCVYVWGPQLPWIRQGWAWIYIWQDQDNGRQYILHNRREKMEKEDKRSKSSPASMAYAKRGLVNSKRSKGKWYVKVWQQAHSWKEQHRSVSNGKGIEEELTKRGDESKTKKETREHMIKEWINPKPAMSIQQGCGPK